MSMLPLFMTTPAGAVLIARTALKTKCRRRQAEKMLKMYCEGLKYSLLTSAADDALAKTDAEITIYRLQPRRTPVAYS